MRSLKEIFGIAGDEDEYYDSVDDGGYDVSSSAVTEEEAGYSSAFSMPQSSFNSQSSFGSSKSAISLHSISNTSKVAVMKPKRFEEMMNDAISALQDGTIIFLNLTETINGEGARIVDFMTGAAAMCGGRVDKVDTCCYSVAPKGVEVNTIED